MRSLALLVLLMLFTSFAVAQSTTAPTTPPPRGGFFQRANDALADLNLSADQKTKIDAILSDVRAKAQAISPAERREKIRPLINAARDQIRALLTPEQASAFDAKLPRGGGGATTVPSSQPSAESQSPRINALIERMQSAGDQLNLSDQQKTQFHQILEDARQKMIDVRNQNLKDPAAARTQIQSVMQEMRQDLAGVLNQDQIEKLRDATSDGFRERGDRPMRAMPSSQPAVETPPPATQADAIIPPTVLEPGQPAPPFALKRFNGNTVQLSEMKNRPLLLVFGSYSSPSFRQRAAQIDKLARMFNNRVDVFIVYTRENYPDGDWNVDRNKDQNIAVPAAKTIYDRTAAAGRTHESLNLSVPMLIDTMDDKTAADYGATTNDAAVLIGKDGKVVAYEKWFDAYAMQDAIKSLLANSNSMRDGS